MPKRSTTTGSIGSRARPARDFSTLKPCASSTMDPRSLTKDFKEFLQCLNAHGVEYLVIGGHAVAFHGYPRATADLDVWVAVNQKNAVRLVAALKEFGFDVPE